MANPDVVFACDFDKSFRSRASSIFFPGEIALFRAMRCALVGLSKQFEIEEYHGNSHQVIFTGDGNYARPKARCELSDLMIITYSLIPQRRARLTYLQAKYERTTVPIVCMRQFSANLEQWFLLSQRPPIKGVGAFKPPCDLLSGALPSIGSFAFFYEDNGVGFQIYYATASYLRPQRQNPTRKGKLLANGPCAVRNARYKECLAACGNQSFAESLYRLEIGTPVGSMAQQTRNWLAAHLRAAQIQEARRSYLAEELLEILVPDTEELEVAPGFFGAKSLIIIKSNFEVRPD